MATVAVSAAEWRILSKLRELRQTHINFKLTVYGLGSPEKRLLDLEWSPRERLNTQETLSPAIDD